MSIKIFIQKKVLVPRLQKTQVLVVYDPDFRYRDLCLEMANEKCLVVNSSESSITSREEAIVSLLRLGKHDIEQLLVYVPTNKPIEEEEKQKDPFSVYMACGAVFPEGDGDNYLSICLKAKPDYATQVRAVFEQNPNPSFDVIDAIGGGSGWPNLRAILKVESARDILFALLSPNDKQKTALNENDSWLSEVRELLKVSIGLSLKTRGKTWSSISDELWRFILFSEFTFDLPVELPISLSNVPHAEESAKPLIEDICEQLRSDQRVQNEYIQRAETIEKELNLREIFAQMEDLGNRDTFFFVERTFLFNAINELLSDNIEKAKAIIFRHSQSVWTGKGENQSQWDFLKSSLLVIETCEDNERVLTDKARSLDTLVDFYISQLREVDQRHREFEQSVSDYVWQDYKGIMIPVQDLVRKKYGELLEKVQVLFTNYFKQTGWPLNGYLANVDVFDKIIAPKLELSGNKVAFIMVDALRYELGIELEKQISEDIKAEITPALVQLPSITSVGMASLLPGAPSGLRLEKYDSGFVPYIYDKTAATVAQRMGIIQQRYGNRFQEGRLEDFVRNRLTVNGDTDLLVLRSVEIDSHFENNPDTAPSEIMHALKRIRMAMYKLKEAGFAEAVIATDHGFFMNTHAGPGDTCSKLSGNWVNIHERSLLGEGSADSHHYCLNVEKVGIKGDYQYFAGPLSLASYKHGMLYYHGGCSLQECIVPVIQLDLKDRSGEIFYDAMIKISYKNDSKLITTRLPVIDISVETNRPLFAGEKDYEILIEAHDKKGDVVGEAKPGGIVNPTTGTCTIKPGDRAQVTMKMNMEFEGKFKIKAINPKTGVAYDQIQLETDYVV